MKVKCGLVTQSREIKLLTLWTGPDLQALHQMSVRLCGNTGARVLWNSSLQAEYKVSALGRPEAHQPKAMCSEKRALCRALISHRSWLCQRMGKDLSKPSFGPEVEWSFHKTLGMPSLKEGMHGQRAFLPAEISGNKEWNWMSDPLELKLQIVLMLGIEPSGPLGEQAVLLISEPSLQPWVDKWDLEVDEADKDGGQSSSQTSITYDWTELTGRPTHIPPHTPKWEANDFSLSLHRAYINSAQYLTKSHKNTSVAGLKKKKSKLELIWKLPPEWLVL